MEARMPLQTRPQANAHPASPDSPPFPRTRALRLLGALLCLGSVAAVVVAEIMAWRDTWLQQTALVRAQQCPPSPDLASPLAYILSGPSTGPQPDLWLAPALLALLVMGVRVLAGKLPAVPPTLAAVLLVVCAFLTYFDILSGRPTFVSGPVCAILPGARFEPAFPLGLLGGLLGCVVLARTTRYRPLGLHDA
jgi:hypothetical protein